MFNLNLLHTALITMGMANTMPIRNANATNNYTLTLQKTYQTGQYVDNQYVNNINISSYSNGRISDQKYNYNNGNSYLNVIGNQYVTQVYLDEDAVPEDLDITLIRNYELIEDLNTDSFSSTQTLVCLKLTPYNYNIETEMNINIQLRLDEFTPTYINEDIIYDHVYMQRTIYNTTQSNWDTYIDKTLVKDTARRVIQEIEDPNNNFYYSKYVNTTELTATNSAYDYVDNMDITIVPNVDNFIFIEYAPTIQARMYDHYADPQYAYTNYAWVNVMGIYGSFQINNINITGTNVIPSGTYEVIDIGGLMFEILTMPFAFVSQAFNLTLFPGTPYQINISNLFLSICAIFVFVWLISLFLKLKG